MSLISVINGGQAQWVEQNDAVVRRVSSPLA